MSQERREFLTTTLGESKPKPKSSYSDKELVGEVVGFANFEAGW